MDSQLNQTIIEKATIKSVAIYKAIAMLPPPSFEDKFKKEILCQQNENTQNQSSEQCLNKPEQKTEPLQNDTTNETKTMNEQENWRSITDPKLREKMRNKAWRQANKEKILLRKKAYCQANKEKIREYKKAYRDANKEKIKSKAKAYRNANIEKIKSKTKAYRDDNIDKAKAWREANRYKIKAWREANRYKIKAWREANREKRNERDRERKKNDIQFRIRKSLRSRINNAIKNKSKTGSAIRDLGCSIPELKQYLESKFQPGMSWDNYGLYGWHIDHIKPLTSFDLSDRNQFLEACHYTNLQPLWAQDNLIKGSKIL